MVIYPPVMSKQRTGKSPCYSWVKSAMSMMIFQFAMGLFTGGYFYQCPHQHPNIHPRSSPNRPPCSAISSPWLALMCLRVCYRELPIEIIEMVDLPRFTKIYLSKNGESPWRTLRFIESQRLSCPHFWFESYPHDISISPRLRCRTHSIDRCHGPS